MAGAGMAWHPPTPPPTHTAAPPRPPFLPPPPPRRLQALGGRRAVQFLSKVQRLAGRLPYMVAPGNHEYHANFSHYRQAGRGGGWVWMGVRVGQRHGAPMPAVGLLH